MANKKRGNGEGTIRELPNGTYCCRIVRPDGKRQAFYGKTRKEAVAKMTAAKNAIAAGLNIPNETRTVAHYVTEWLDLTEQDLRPSTIERYESLLRRHLVEPLGKTPLIRLTPGALRGLYKAKVQQDGLSPTTVGQLHRVIHHMLRDAASDGYVNRNVAGLVRPPKQTKRERLVLSGSQSANLISAVRGQRLEALYVLALHTGMREGELFGLSWNDIDMERASLSVQNGLRWSSSGWSLGPLKTNSSERTIALNSAVLSSLRRHRNLQIREQLALGPAWIDNGLVFTNRAGNPTSPQNHLRRDHYPLLARIGLPRLTFHDLRHTAASLALAQGVPIPQVSKLLGHASPAVTMSIYAHALPDTDREVADAMAQAIVAS